jgi:DMSO reductase anchor subunit
MKSLEASWGWKEGTEMARAESSGFHELPLVLFSALVSGGAGVGAAQLVHGLLGWTDLVPSAEVTFIVATLLSMGLLSSLGHLGRPARGHKALRRVGRSPLSNEVAVVGMAAVVALVTFFLPSGGALRAGSGLACVFLAIPVLLSVGIVYRIAGQITWAGLAPYQPLVLGLGFGLTVLLSWLPDGAQARGDLLVLSVLMVDAFFVWERAKTIGHAWRHGHPVHPKLMDQRSSALSLRVLLGILLPAVALLTGLRQLATLSLFANLFFDRFLFYGLAVRANTEAEVMKVEMALEAAVASPRDS